MSGILGGIGKQPVGRYDPATPGSLSAFFPNLPTEQEQVPPPKIPIVLITGRKVRD